jgi:hypothetical protein
MDAKQTIRIYRGELLSLVRQAGYTVPADTDVTVTVREGPNYHDATVLIQEEPIEILFDVAPLRHGIPSDLYDRLWDLWREGQKIKVIKELRSITGWGLKEAKGWTDTYFGPLTGNLTGR